MWRIPKYNWSGEEKKNTHWLGSVAAFKYSYKAIPICMLITASEVEIAIECAKQLFQHGGSHDKWISFSYIYILVI